MGQPEKVSVMTAKDRDKVYGGINNQLIISYKVQSKIDYHAPPLLSWRVGDEGVYS